MPKKLDEIHDAVARKLRGKINPRTKKKYTEAEIWAIARAQYEKLGEKSFTFKSMISKCWEQEIEVDKSISETGKANKRFVETIVSGLKEDREGDMMTQAAIDDMIIQFKSGKIPFFADHGISEGVPDYSWKGIMGVWVDAHQENEKLKAVVRLNDAHPDANLFWNFTQEGMPLAFSIAGGAVEEVEEEDGKEA